MLYQPLPTFFYTKNQRAEKIIPILLPVSMNKNHQFEEDTNIDRLKLVKIWIRYDIPIHAVPVNSKTVKKYISSLGIVYSFNINGDVLQYVYL
jgi:hypothetical protein